MADDDSEERDREIERDARRGRKFTLADAIGKEGASFFHGESPVPMLARATAGLCMFVAEHVSDSSGALHAVLERRIKGSETIVGAHFDDPLNALEIIVEQMLSSDARLFEIVRQVDAEWGRIMLERPHFQQPGEEPHPDDEHTHESVRAKLEGLLAKLRQ
jgi:hypothetical protein